MWGADRMDHMDSKSMQPGETPGHLAIMIQSFAFQMAPAYFAQPYENRLSP